MSCYSNSWMKKPTLYCPLGHGSFWALFYLTTLLRMVTNMPEDTKLSLSKPRTFLKTKLFSEFSWGSLELEEITIAKEIEKSTKSNPPSFLLFSSQVFNSQLPLARAHSYISCYACGLEGLIARNCRARRGHNSQRYHNHVACTLVYNLNY